MAGVYSFKDLLVWQKAHELVIAVYKVTSLFTDEERYGLTSQLRRAAVSVAANIVEGYRRKGFKDSLNFYNKSDSSLEEVRYLLFLSQDLQYILNEKYEQLESLSCDVSRMLHAWVKSQKENVHNSECTVPRLSRLTSLYLAKN